MSVQSINPQISTPPVTQVQKRYPAPAIASFILPGTGQFLKEDNKKSLRDLGIFLGLTAVAGITGILAGVKLQSGALTKNTAIVSGSILAVTSLAGLANRFHSAIDAYKAKPTKEAVKES